MAGAVLRESAVGPCADGDRADEFQKAGAADGTLKHDLILGIDLLDLRTGG